MSANITNNAKYNARYSYTQIAASTLVKTGQGLLGGIFVSALGTTPTITVYDQTSAATPVILATFIPTVGQNVILNVQFQTGLYVAIGGSGTTNISVFYR